MAVGDDAAAAGMDIVPGATAAHTIDTELNKTRDYIAQRTSAVQPVVKGGTGAAAAPAARTNLGITAANTPSTAGNVQTDLDYISAVLGGKLDKSSAQYNADFAARDAGIAEAKDGQLTSNVYNRNLTGTRRAAWVQDNGLLGYASSSERYKKTIQPFNVTDEQVAMLSLVSFQWRAAVAVDDRTEIGLIAERLVEAGLEWVVFHDEQGRPEGINYDRIGLALIPTIQRLLARVTALEGAQT